MHLSSPDDIGMAHAVLSHYRNFETIKEAADALNMPRTTFRDWVKKARSFEGKEAPKILFWDIETSYMTIEYNTYDLKVGLKRHPIDHIKEDWFMLGAAWMLLDDKKPTVISVSPKDPRNDYEVVSTLHMVLSDADILVGHNSDAFDLKKFNARAIKYDLPPIPQKKTVDTLKVARKHFKFTSNTLRYIANYLGVSAKDESPNWKKCIEGDADELRYMREYNKQDVLVTKEVYLKLRPHISNHPNLNTYLALRDAKDERYDVCPSCGSHDLSRTPYHKYTQAGKYQLLQCGSCRSYSIDSKNRVKVTIR